MTMLIMLVYHDSNSKLINIYNNTNNDDNSSSSSWQEAGIESRTMIVSLFFLYSTIVHS